MSFDLRMKERDYNTVNGKMNVGVIRADFYGKVTSQYTIHLQY